LLYLDLDRQRWVWDEEKISSLKLPLNVAAYFTSGISKLPIEVQLALHTVAMFGFHARSVYLECLERQLKVKILDPLKVAVAEGLVMNIIGYYTFAHDRIQEACYGMIGLQDRRLNHITYGRCLLKRR
jgi:predicted ATPase